MVGVVKKPLKLKGAKGSQLEVKKAETEAERVRRVVEKKREEQKKISYRKRIEEFNEKLASVTEFNEVPKMKT